MLRVHLKNPQSLAGRIPIDCAQCDARATFADAAKQHWAFIRDGVYHCIGCAPRTRRVRTAHG